MGRDKARLAVAGESLAARAAATLAEHCERVVLVGRGASPVAGVASLADRRPGQGPLAGLERALEAARGNDVLLLACDLPSVDRQLLERVAARPPGFGAVPAARVAAGGRGLQPLCALYSASCAGPVSAALDRGERAMHRLLESLQVTAVEAGGRLVNLNTPEDWERWTAAERPVGEPS